MIGNKDIEEKAAEFSISPIEVEKDYVYSWLLKAIYERPDLSQRLVLKGGQAIRKDALRRISSLRRTIQAAVLRSKKR